MTFYALDGSGLAGGGSVRCPGHVIEAHDGRFDPRTGTCDVDETVRSLGT